MRRRSSSSVVGSVQRGRPLNLGVPVSSRKASIASWTGASNGSRRTCPNKLHVAARIAALMGLD